MFSTQTVKRAAGALVLALACFLPFASVSCVKGSPGDQARQAIAVARDANEIALKTCDALQDEREANAKFDRFCSEAVRTAEALAALERLSSFIPAPAAPEASASGGSASASGGAGGAP